MNSSAVCERLLLPGPIFRDGNDIDIQDHQPLFGNGRLHFGGFSYDGKLNGQFDVLLQIISCLFLFTAERGNSDKCLQ